MPSQVLQAFAAAGASLCLLANACHEPETPRAFAPPPAAPSPPAALATAASSAPTVAPVAPLAKSDPSLACKDAGSGERMALERKPGHEWQISAFLNVLPTDVPYYEIDGRQPIYQRVTRELRGFLPLDPAARFATWKLILDPPVKDVERNAFFMPDRDAPTTPVVDLVSNTPIGMLVWALNGGNPAFSAGLYLQGARGSYYMLGQQAYVGIDAAAQLSKTEIVIAKRGDSGASLCTATRKTCEPRLERPGLSTDALAIARAPDGELALVDFARNGAAPALHRGTDTAPRELPPVSGLVAASDSRCAGTAEWAVVGRASVLRYEATTYPSWLLMRLVGATWCVDAVDYWRGPLNRVVARFGAQPEAARYEFTDDSAAVVRTPVGCGIEPAR